MRFGIKKAAAVILMSIIFAGATAQTAQAYNLAPQSFQNFYNTASAGNLQGLQSMIYRGLSLESTNQNGDTAICVAIRSQDAIAYRTLKQAGADIEPSCLKKISDEQKDAFFEQNDPEYAVQRSKSQWSKTGTAVLIGGGVAAGVIALAASGGGSGGGHSDDSTPIAPTCEDNPCGEGCFNNLACPAGQVCSSSNTCGGCESCAVKSECTSVANKCNAGCYTNLVCQAGYECAAKNECGGCESCTKKSICATNKCASGCYTDIGCGENKACTAHNTCGGCTRCDYINHPNANHCVDFDTKNNICLRCRSGYTVVDGICQSDKPSHCVKYDYTTKICSMCDAGYSLSSDQKSCIRDTDANCTAANFPLTSIPTNANISSCYDGSTTRYKIVSCKPNYTLAADGKSCVQNSSGGDTGTCNATNYPLTTKPDDTSTNYTFCIDGTTTRYKITSCKPNYTLAADGKSCTKGGSSGGEETVTCNTTDFPLSECPNGSHCVPCVDTSGKHYKFIECLFGFRRVGDECVEMTESDDNFFHTPKVNDSDLVIDKKNIVTIEGNLYQYGFTNYGGWENVNIFNAYTKDASITVTGDENNNMYGNIIALNAVERIKNSVVASQSSPAAVNAYKHKGVITVKDWIGQATGISSPGIAYNAMDNGNGSIDISVKPNFENSQQLGATGIFGNHGVYNAYNTQENGTTTGDINITVNRGGVYQKYGDIHGMELWYSDTQNGYPATIINAFNGGKGNITITINNNEQDGSYAAVGVGMFGSNGHLLANAYGNNSVGNITITSSGISYGNGIDLHGKSTWLGSAYNAYGEGATGYITINGNGNGIIGGEGLDGFHDGRLSNADNGAQGYITINGLGRGMSCGSSDSKYKNNGYCFNGSNGGYGYITINVPENAESFSQEDLPSDFPFEAVGILSGHNGSPSLGVGTIKITNNSDKSVVGVYNGNNYANSTITITSKAKQPEEIDNKKLYGTFGIYRDDDKVSNYGKIDITATGSANAYGIYTKDIVAINEKGGSITLDTDSSVVHGIYGNKSIYNNGSITVNQSYFKDSYIQSGIYLEENENSNGVETVYNKGNISLRMPSNVTVPDYNIPFSASGYGIYSTGNVQNSGNIDITNGTLASSAYGIFSKIPNQSTNTGRITVKGGANYGLINVNNGVGGYINLAPTYFKDNNGLDEARGTGMVSYRPNSYSNDITINLVNGSASTPATSVNDTTKGYITVVGNGANKSPTIFGPYFRPTLIGISGEDNTNIYNYGVISMQGSSIAGIYNGASGKIYNYGYININANYSTAAGILSESDDVEIYNEKEIIITASTTFANRYWYGIAGGNITNNGNLTMNIMNGYSAIAMTSGINNGNITVSLSDKTNADGIRGAGINNGNIKINGGINVNGMFVSQDLTSGEIKDIKAINNKSGNIMLDNISNGNGIAAANKTTAYNEGNITISNSTATAALYGISLEREAKAINSGNITISNISGKNVYGIYGINKKNDEYLDGSGVILNSGNIEISDATGDNVYGIYADQYKIKNTGNITLSNVDESSSYGIYAINGSKVYNSGTITINGESYNKNEADGKFIYIDSSSSMINESEITASTAFDTAALGGGKFVLGKDGKITAPEIKGDITADAGITSGGFDKTYSNKNAFSGKTDEVKLNSGSALFDAALKNNDIVMTMKDFDEVVDDKSLAAYLQRNYEAKRNEQLFNSLKFHATSASLNNSLNQQLGFSLLPNFAQENMNVFRSLSNLVTDTMFAQDLTNERMMVGYDYLGQDRASKGRVTGYENTANSSYFLADTKLNNRQRFGLGVALTRFNSDYDDDSTRKATFAQALGSYMHDFGNRWKYAGLLRVGYADGDYKRQSDNERVSGDTSDILYGFNNELRYNYDLGFMTLEPQVELNAYGYYQRKIKENDEKISALLVDGTNNLSIEAGAGLYAGKETVYGETGRVKARLGGSYYRELSQPYHTMRTRVRDTDGYYLIESADIFDRNRVIVRADITFSWKALDFYLRGSQFMEDKHTTVINAGIKFNF